MVHTGSATVYLQLTSRPNFHRYFHYLASNLVTWAQDQTGAENVEGSIGRRYKPEPSQTRQQREASILKDRLKEESETLENKNKKL